jgi:hypothetical protein
MSPIAPNKDITKTQKAIRKLFETLSFLENILL